MPEIDRNRPLCFLNKGEGRVAAGEGAVDDVHGSDTVSLACHLRGRGNREAVQLSGRSAEHVGSDACVQSQLYGALVVEGVQHATQETE